VRIPVGQMGLRGLCVKCQFAGLKVPVGCQGVSEQSDLACPSQEDKTDVTLKAFCDENRNHAVALADVIELQTRIRANGQRLKL
jgi:hypothetical protein